MSWGGWERQRFAQFPSIFDSVLSPVWSTDALGGLYSPATKLSRYPETTALNHQIWRCSQFQLSTLRKGLTLRQTEASWSHLMCISLQCELNPSSTRCGIKWSAPTLHVHALKREAESFRCDMCGEGLLEYLFVNLRSNVSVASSDQNGPKTPVEVNPCRGVFEVYRGPQQVVRTRPRVLPY